MSEQSDELKELGAIAANMKLSAKMRIDAIEQMGKITTHEAFLTLLDIAANEGLLIKERDLCLKQAREILRKTSH
jgi:hypothetical protein